MVRLPRWNEAQIGALIEKRSRQAGIEPDFTRLELDSRLDEVQFESEQDRSRYGFYRSLWLSSGGNPAIALRLWAGSLRHTREEKVVVRMPAPARAGLEQSSWAVQCLIRFLALAEVATREEILSGLGVRADDVVLAIMSTEARGWIEEKEGHYRLSWEAYRALTAALTRLNLLAPPRSSSASWFPAGG
jgi:hypothetical protein